MNRFADLVIGHSMLEEKLGWGVSNAGTLKIDDIRLVWKTGPIQQAVMVITFGKKAFECLG